MLDVRAVTKHFPIGGGFRQRRFVHALDGISLQIGRGETLGLVGESGSGKSTLGRIIAQLLPPTSGQVVFEGTDVTALRGRNLRRFRRNIQMIFQDPYASLNPRMTVGQIVAEPLHNFGIGSRAERHSLIDDALARCGLDPAFRNRYPHQFSGGQRQRIGIARVLAVAPKLIIADEPVSALDVSIQAQVINLLRDLQQEFGLTYLFVSHDLSVVRYISDRVAVMYLGKLVEVAAADDIHNRALHPYTLTLLSSVPIPDPEAERKRKLVPVSGEVPSPISPPSGCRFHPRCPIARLPICSTVEPPLEEKRPGQWAACHFVEDAEKLRVSGGFGAMSSPARDHALADGGTPQSDGGQSPGP